ncbi:MAG: 50S ribosomal protein L4 [Fervidicoccaceae archaeon]
MPIFIDNSSAKRVPVYGINGVQVGEVVLPPIFRAPIRRDLILRAFLAEFTASLQPKGRDPMAGKRTSARSLGVGYGLARVPRVRGTTRAAFVNFAVGGMVAHPPRVEERIRENINRRERLLATISAISSTTDPNLVKRRGHRFSAEILPIVLHDEVEQNVRSAKEARALMEALGVYEDIERSKDRTRIKAGRGKMRGRKYVEPKSLLFVLSSRLSPLARSVRNFPGVDVETAATLSVLSLAPGGIPGRLAIYTISSLDALQKRFEELLVVK